MIKAEHISINKEGNLVMQLDAFESRQGAMTGLVGPSGSGKSTLLNCLSLLEPTHTGSLMVDGKDVTRSTNAEKESSGRSGRLLSFRTTALLLSGRWKRTLLCRNPVGGVV